MKCLDSLQSCSVDGWQLIILANGTELSGEIQKRAESLTSHFTLLQSDVVMTPGKARNMAILSAMNEWIFFIDDDAFVPKGYWDVAFPLLQDPKIQVLGGPDSPAPGMNAFSLSLAFALSSPFCTGSTFGRHKSFGTKLQIVDEEKLTSCNLWIRKTVLNDLRFPEDYKRAEETVLLQKIKKSDVNLYYHPKLKVAHHRRTKLAQLFKPTFRAGFYRSRLMKEKLKKNNEIFWLPAFFVVLHSFIFIEPEVFWYLARLYGSIIVLFSLGLAMRVKRIALFPIIAFLHYFIVLLYGVGFIAERVGRLKS